MSCIINQKEIKILYLLVFSSYNIPVYFPINKFFFRIFLCSFPFHRISNSFTSSPIA